MLQLFLMAEFLSTHHGYPGILLLNMRCMNYERITILYNVMIFYDVLKIVCVQRWPKGELPLPANEILHSPSKLSGFQAWHFWAPEAELVNEIMS